MGWKSGVGIVVLLAVAGLGAGLVHGVWKTTADFSLLSESERPKRLEQMHAAVKAFYAKPTDATQEAARDAMLNYRRTFPDTHRGSLQALSEKIECGETRECQMLRERRNKEHIALAGQIVNRYPMLSTSSMEYHTKVAIDLALERRLHGDVPLAYINEDAKYFKNEAELAGMRTRFFSDIDKAARNEGIGERELMEYLQLYAKSAKETFKPIKPGRQCPPIQASTEDGRQCSRSTSEVQAAYRLPDKAAKAALAKKAITERDAPIEMLQQSLTQIFRQ